MSTCFQLWEARRRFGSGMQLVPEQCQFFLHLALSEPLNEGAKWTVLNRAFLLFV